MMLDAGRKRPRPEEEVSWCREDAMELPKRRQTALLEALQALHAQLVRSLAAATTPPVEAPAEMMTTAAIAAAEEEEELQALLKQKQALVQQLRRHRAEAGQALPPGGISSRPRGEAHHDQLLWEMSAMAVDFFQERSLRGHVLARLTQEVRQYPVLRSEQMRLVASRIAAVCCDFWRTERSSRIGSDVPFEVMLAGETSEPESSTGKSVVEEERLSADRPLSFTESKDKVDEKPDFDDEPIWSINEGNATLEETLQHLGSVVETHLSQLQDASKDENAMLQRLSSNFNNVMGCIILDSMSKSGQFNTFEISLAILRYLFSKPGSHLIITSSELAFAWRSKIELITGKATTSDVIVASISEFRQENKSDHTRVSQLAKQRWCCVVFDECAVQDILKSEKTRSENVSSDHQTAGERIAFLNSYQRIVLSCNLEKEVQQQPTERQAVQLILTVPSLSLSLSRARDAIINSHAARSLELLQKLTFEFAFHIDPNNPAISTRDIPCEELPQQARVRNFLLDTFFRDEKTFFLEGLERASAYLGLVLPKQPKTPFLFPGVSLQGLKEMDHIFVKMLKSYPLVNALFKNDIIESRSLNLRTYELSLSGDRSTLKLRGLKHAKQQGSESNGFFSENIFRCWQAVPWIGSDTISAVNANIKAPPHILLHEKEEQEKNNSSTLVVVPPVVITHGDVFETDYGTPVLLPDLFSEGENKLKALVSIIQDARSLNSSRILVLSGFSEVLDIAKAYLRSKGGGVLCERLDDHQHLSNNFFIPSSEKGVMVGFASISFLSTLAEIASACFADGRIPELRTIVLMDPPRVAWQELQNFVSRSISNSEVDVFRLFTKGTVEEFSLNLKNPKTSSELLDYALEEHRRERNRKQFTLDRDEEDILLSNPPTWNEILTFFLGEEIPGEPFLLKQNDLPPKVECPLAVYRTTMMKLCEISDTIEVTSRVQSKATIKEMGLPLFYPLNSETSIITDVPFAREEEMSYQSSARNHWIINSRAHQSQQKRPRAGSDEAFPLSSSSDFRSSSSSNSNNSNEMSQTRIRSGSLIDLLSSTGSRPAPTSDVTVAVQEPSKKKKVQSTTGSTSASARVTNRGVFPTNSEVFTPQEDELILRLHREFGANWSLVASQLNRKGRDGAVARTLRSSRQISERFAQLAGDSGSARQSLLAPSLPTKLDNDDAFFLVPRRDLT